MKRKYPIQVRVSESEKESLMELAKEANLSISEYMRQTALNSFAQVSGESLRQKLIPKLCELSDLCSLIDDDDVRKKIQDWRHSIWLSLK